MNTIMCSRCHKRLAVIFITRVENGESKQEGICINCARELGIKPVNDIIQKMGLSDDDIERMNSDVEQLIENGDMNDESGLSLFSEPPTSPDAKDSEKTPTINFGELLRKSMGGGDKKQSGKKRADGSKPPERKALNQYCRNLTDRAKRGELDRVVGRERDLDRIIQILCRRQKNNPCLIGEPGVGKTAIAEALAQRIVDGKVPYKLASSEVMLLDMTSLVAGTQFRGQFEARMLALLGEIKAAGNIILVIDEVHNLVGAGGDAGGSMNAANIMKPALSRGEVQVIGATTLTEYRKHIESDSALERRFQPVNIAEPSVSEAIEILRGIKHYYEEYHGITIPEGVLSYAVTMSERYITDRYLPDKAIDLLDEAASRLSLSSPDINERLRLRDESVKLIDEISAIEAKINGGEADNEAYEKLANLKSNDLAIKDKLTELDDKCKKIEMTVENLADVIEIWTGIPASTIKEDEFSRLEQLEDRLSARIVGQSEAVSAVSRAIRRGRAGVAIKRKPVSFIFAGPTGVGKTELVKVLAEDLFSTPETLIRLDMSEFMEKYSVSRIIGSPPGYVGYDDGGQLTEKIRRRPYSVVLFDEIEKAHPDVMNILLQILDDGRITDSHGKTVSFENTVIVMTTNAGSGTAASKVGFTEAPEKAESDRTMKALSDFLRPEFINRVDEIITFRSLTPDDFKEIAKIMLGDLKRGLKDRGVELIYSDAVAEYIANRSYSVKFGARNMRRFIQTELEDNIAGKIIAMRGKLSSVTADVYDGMLVVTAL